MKYDHWRSIVDIELQDSDTGEVFEQEEELEGGFTGFPNDYKNWNKYEKREYLKNLVQDWYPELKIIKLKGFWLAG